MGKSLKEFPCSYHPLCGCDGARRQNRKKKSATEEESGGICAQCADLLFIFELRRLIRACRAHPFCEAAENFSGALAPNVWLRVEAELRRTAASERRGGVCQAADVPNLFLFRWCFSIRRNCICKHETAARVLTGVKQVAP